MTVYTKHAKRYIPIGSTPRAIPAGRIVVHNHVRPTSRIGSRGFRVWTDTPRPRDYRVTRCRCGWAPHLPNHYRVVVEEDRP